MRLPPASSISSDVQALGIHLGDGVGEGLLDGRVLLRDVGREVELRGLDPAAGASAAARTEGTPPRPVPDPDLALPRTEERTTAAGVERRTACIFPLFYYASGREGTRAPYKGGGFQFLEEERASPSPPLRSAVADPRAREPVPKPSTKKTEGSISSLFSANHPRISRSSRERSGGAPAC